MRSAFFNLSSSVVALGALRSGPVLTMIMLAYMLSVDEMGEISAVYGIVVAGAQVVGYALSSLALDLAKDRGPSIKETSQIALTCLLWWVIISIVMVLFCVFSISFTKSFLFNNLVSSFAYFLGILWLCGTALEIMAVSLAVGTHKMSLLAKLGLFQASSMMLLTPIAVMRYGSVGFGMLAVLSYACGTVIMLSLKPWLAFSFWLVIINSGLRSLNRVLGPSLAAALFHAALSVALISGMSHQPNATNEIAYFVIAMQILSIGSFVPQVICNITLSKCYRSEQNLKLNQQHLKKGAIQSFLTCIALAIIIFSANQIFSIFPDKYLAVSDALIFTMLLLIVQGPSQIITYVYVFSEKQWRLAAISMISTILGILFFWFSDEKNSFAMIGSILFANMFRLFVMSIEFNSKIFSRKIKN